MAVDLEEFKQRLNIPASDMTLECALIFHEARGLEARGQFDDAVNAYKKVLEMAPDDAVAYVGWPPCTSSGHRPPRHPAPSREIGRAHV